MKNRNIQKFAMPAFVAVSLSLSTNAFAAIDSNASVVLLRASCNDGAGGTLNNCFTSMSSLSTWIWNTRNPSASNRLLVDIGPGSFGGFSCLGSQSTPRGWVTLRGSGQGATKLASSSGQGATIKSDGCTDLIFESLTIAQNHGDGATGYGIQWLNGGMSVWNNVAVEVNAPAGGFRAAGWYESGCVGGVTTLPMGKHYWFSSRFKVTVRGAVNTVGYSTQCPAESWFYGTEIDVVAIGASTGSSIAGVEIGAGLNQFYGSAIRVRVDADSPSNTAFAQFAGVSPQFYSGASGMFHMHGGIIAVDASASTQAFDVASALAIDGFHAFETAYRLKPPAIGGAATRLTVAAEAPFMWQPSAEPPNVVSANGADTFVETDCSAAGCQTAGTETHLHIYNDTCNTAGPWFDTTTGRCRGL